MHGLNHAVVRQQTFLPSNSGGKVFLCPEAVEPVRPVEPVARLLQRANWPNGHNAS